MNDPQRQSHYLNEGPASYLYPKCCYFIYGTYLHRCVKEKSFGHSIGLQKKQIGNNLSLENHIAHTFEVQFILQPEKNSFQDSD